MVTAKKPGSVVIPLLVLTAFSSLQHSSPWVGAAPVAAASPADCYTGVGYGDGSGSGVRCDDNDNATAANYDPNMGSGSSSTAAGSLEDEVAAVVAGLEGGADDTAGRPVMPDATEFCERRAACACACASSSNAAADAAAGEGMGRGGGVGGPPSNYACLNGLAVVENVAAGRIKVFEAGINVGALIIIAVNEERVDLIPALIAHGVPAWRRNPVTDELPHATVLQHTSVLTGSTLGIQVVELLFASHCQFDLACCKAMDGPNGSRVRTTVGAALQTLAQANWRGRHDNATVLHRVATACKQGNLTESQAVQLTNAAASAVPEMVQECNAFSQLPLDIALLCEGCFSLQRQLSPLLFNRYQPIYPFVPMYRSTTSAVFRCTGAAGHIRGINAASTGIATINTTNATNAITNTIGSHTMSKPHAGKIVAVKVMASAKQWRKELEARRRLQASSTHPPSAHAVSALLSLTSAAAITVTDSAQDLDIREDGYGGRNRGEGGRDNAHFTNLLGHNLTLLRPIDVEWQRWSQMQELMQRYPFCIALPCADQTLADLIRSEELMMHTVDNLIHFDLTPENIVFLSAEVANSEDGTSGSSNDSSGRGRRAKFGEAARVAKLVDPKMTIPKTADPTTVESSNAYMSDHSRSLDNVSRQSMASSTAYHCPEVVEWVKYGSVLPLSTALSKLVSRTQADIWAFGAIMYEMVTGAPLCDHTYGRIRATAQRRLLAWD
eukprot:gene14976-30470_t